MLTSLDFVTSSRTPPFDEKWFSTPVKNTAFWREADFQFPSRTIPFDEICFQFPSKPLPFDENHIFNSRQNRYLLTNINFISRQNHHCLTRTNFQFWYGLLCVGRFRNLRLLISTWLGTFHRKTLGDRRLDWGHNQIARRRAHSSRTSEVHCQSVDRLACSFAAPGCQREGRKSQAAQTGSRKSWLQQVTPKSRNVDFLKRYISKVVIIGESGAGTMQNLVITLINKPG